MKNNLTEYFKNTVHNFPNKIAIDDNEEIISFSELDDISNKIANSIISRNIISRKPIAVFLPKNRWSVLSYIAIVKTGNFYAPLDIKSPIERISKILNNLNPNIIVTDLANLDTLKTIGFTGEIILIEEHLLKKLEDYDYIADL